MLFQNILVIDKKNKIKVSYGYMDFYFMQIPVLYELNIQYTYIVGKYQIYLYQL